MAGIVAATAGCDPCGLVLSCRQAPVVAVTGQVVDAETGASISNAAITARYESGVSVAGSPTQTRTSSDGYFEVSFPAASAGNTWLEFTVASPGRSPYVVPGVRATAKLTAGDAEVLAPWVSSRPEIPFALFIQSRSGADVNGATITFQRTAGRRLFSGGSPVPSIQGMTEGGGLIFLFSGASTDTVGDVVGNIIVARPGAPVVTVPGMVITSVPEFRRQHSTILVEIP